MRHWIVALFAILAAPAAAQQSPSDQAIAAYQTFYQGLQPEGLYEGGYFDAVTTGIEGRWIAGTLFFLNDNPDAESLAAKLSEACSGPIIAELSVVEPFTLEVRHPRPENEYTVSYVYAGGARFSSQIDAKAYLEYLNLTEDRMRQQAVLSLVGATQDVLIFRPDADVLVVARMGGNPDIYTRCIEGGPSPVDTSALEAALRLAFDEQFPKAKNPAVRETFVSCVVAAFASLPPADVQLLIDTNFEPEPEEMERIGNAYPEVRDASIACGEATEATLGR